MYRGVELFVSYTHEVVLLLYPMYMIVLMFYLHSSNELIVPYNSQTNYLQINFHVIPMTSRLVDQHRKNDPTSIPARSKRIHEQIRWL